MAPRALTPKQNRFVAAYLVSLNATQAAIEAGYPAASAAQVGHELLEKTLVKQAVEEAIERRSARVEVKQDDVLRELLRLAMVDPGEAFDADGRLLSIRDMPPDVRRAISGFEVEALFDSETDDDGKRRRVQVGVTTKVKWWDKTKGLELLGKHLKLFTDKVEHSGQLTLEQLVQASMGDGGKP